MASSNSPLLLFLLLLVSASFHLSLGHEINSETDRRKGVCGIRVGRRVLMSFKETPSGGNVTFECSPSGPCIPCLYSEKDHYFSWKASSCLEMPPSNAGLDIRGIRAGSKEADSQKTHKSRSALENSYDSAKLHVMLHDAKKLTTSIRHRYLLDDSSTLEGGSQAYITYRSCIPAANEEKLSILGFEGIILCLLHLSSSVVYFRRKRMGAISGVGAGRTSNNSRF